MRRIASIRIDSRAGWWTIGAPSSRRGLALLRRLPCIRTAGRMDELAAGRRLHSARDPTRDPHARLVHHPRGTGRCRQDDAGDGPCRASRRTEAWTSTLTREPGGTWLGERLRDVLLARTDTAAPTDPLTDALLFNAARRQLVTEVIRPALDAGRTVLCARYADSTLAYQGYGAGVPLDDAAGARGGRHRWAAARPDDPARRARRGRPGAEGARRRDPLRGRVRPRLPPTRPRRVPGPRGGRTGPIRGRRRHPRRRRRWPPRWPPRPTGCSVAVNRNRTPMRTTG